MIVFGRWLVAYALDDGSRKVTCPEETEQTDDYEAFLDGLQGLARYSRTSRESYL